MLLLNMTHEEVCNEILKDLPNVQRWEEHQWNKYRRMSLKMREFPKYLFTEYKSPRKNTWLVSTKFFGKDDFSSTFGVLQIQNGLVLHQAFVGMDNKFSTLCTFIPHFFERYAQYNKLDLKGKELIKKVLKDDCSFNIDKTNAISGRRDRDKENNIHACMSHGVGMGYEVGPHHFLIKTYITYDMSFGKQKKVFEQKREDVTSVASDKPLPYQRTRFLGVPMPNVAISDSIIKKLKRKLNLS